MKIHLQPSKREGVIDPFHSFLIRNAEFSDRHELPLVRSVEFIPGRVIPFSKAISRKWKEYNCWVCFYEDDRFFECFWNNPRKYLRTLKKFLGVISPDFSLSIYGPWSYNFIQTYRGRALAAWLQENGVPVIANVRYANMASKDYCCEGLPCGGTIAIGTLGSLRNDDKRKALIEGLEFIVSSLNPKTIVAYGECPDSIFGKYRRRGILVIPCKALTRIARDASKERARIAANESMEKIQGRLF